MEHRALAALVIRLVGFWELVVAANALPNAIGPFFNPQYVQQASLFVLIGSAMFAVVLPLAVGVLLIYFPRTIASGAVRVEGVEPNGDEASQLERVGVCLMGLWLVIDAAMDAVYNASRWHLYNRVIERQYGAGAEGPPIGPTEFAGLVTAVIQLLLGLWLLIGTQGLVNLFQRLRGRA